MGVPYTDNIVHELSKDLGDSQIDMTSPLDARTTDLLAFVDEVPPFLLIPYHQTKQVVQAQHTPVPEKTIPVTKPLTRHDPVSRFHYYQALWSKDKAVSHMGRQVNEQYKLIYGRK